MSDESIMSVEHEGFNRVIAYNSNGSVLASQRCSDADTERVHDEFMAIPGAQGVTTFAFPASAVREAVPTVVRQR